MPRAPLLAAFLLIAGVACAQDDVWTNIFKFQMTLAQKGDAGAMYRIGEMYAQGKGAAKDPDKALTWLEKAHQAGHPDALAMIERLRAPAEPTPVPATPEPAPPPSAAPAKRAEPATTTPRSSPETRRAKAASGSSNGRSEAAPAARNTDLPRSSPAKPTSTAPTRDRAARAPVASPRAAPSAPPQEPASTPATTSPPPASRTTAPTETVTAFPEDDTAIRAAPAPTADVQPETAADEQPAEAGFRGNPCASKAAKFTSLCR